MGLRTIDGRARGLGLAMALLLGLGGLAGCGGDDDDGAALDADAGTGAADAADDGGGDAPPGAPTSPGEALGVCDMLQVSEIEAQFGDLGAIAEGETTAMGCEWQVGEPVEGAPIDSALTLQVLFHPGDELEGFYPNGAEQAEADLAEVSGRDDVVPISGLGDEAVLDFGVLYVRSGEILYAVGGYMIPNAPLGTDAMQAKLTALAEQVLGRL
jgi:hypothetical protein